MRWVSYCTATSSIFQSRLDHEELETHTVSGRVVRSIIQSEAFDATVRDNGDAHTVEKV